ncbi:Isoleucine--tRNA ligase [Rhynchospora pubera]|uniref:Isoleucine--tRNA ligase n=1 Tax=Rhynchospora pubera TaxID=906938 RepID=A0AAV8DU38_9POAL|nr:Isoleucine--tRNA ligase [Rhynchospora pubera]
MAKHRLGLSLIILSFLLTPTPPCASALSFYQWRTLLSLSKSLLSRVANARYARGDLSGAARVRNLASNLHLLTVNSGVFSLGWDYVWNYYSTSLDLPLEDITRLAKKVSEVSRVGSKERIALWISENYLDLRQLSESVVQGLLRTFSRSGALRDTVLAMKKEIEEGDLLKDFLEVGSKDFLGLLQIGKDIFCSFSPSGSTPESEL